jgi:hypothetical protein
LLFVAGRGLKHGAVREHFAATRKRERFLGGTAALRAYITRREQLRVAMRAHFADEGVAL